VKKMSNNIINEKSMTVTESKRLEKLEGVIKENFLGFVAVGNALAEIRAKRLYRNDENRTFEGYCRDLWDMSHQHADRLVASAKVLDNLTPIGVKKEDDPNFLLPLNEAQARELAPLEAEEQQEVWQEILDHRLTQYKKGQFPKITAITVKKAVLKFKGKKIEVQIDQSTREPKNNRKDFASDEFNQAYTVFGEQIKEAQAGNWRHTSRSVVFNNLSTLLDLVAVAGPKELKKRGCSMELSNREKLAKKGFQIYRMRPKELVIQEWMHGDTWMAASSHDTPTQLSDAFKELMDEPGNLRA
jgi:hypothetical protein